MSDRLTRALALIHADPKQRAAYELGDMSGRCALRRDMVDLSALVTDKAAAYLLLAETPPGRVDELAPGIDQCCYFVGDTRFTGPNNLCGLCFDHHDIIENEARTAAGLIPPPTTPARTYTVDEAYQLIRRANAARLDLVNASELVVNDRAKLLWSDLDSDARAATEGALSEACRRLAALVPEVKRV